MAIDINSIVSEETQSIQSEVDARVLTRLQAARQSAQDRLANDQAELEQVSQLIAERTPESPTGQAEGDVEVSQG